MLTTTRGLVLRSVKYGETSLITTIFTEQFGVLSFLVQGIRSPKAKKIRSGYLQPSILLELSVYHQPGHSLQRLKEFDPLFVYASIHDDIVKSSISIFCTELLLRMLPQNAIADELFLFIVDFFKLLDLQPKSAVVNLPIHFAAMCGKHLGFEITGTYSADTPYLDMKDGLFTDRPPSVPPFLSTAETEALHKMLQAPNHIEISGIPMTGIMRYNILEWYVSFLQRHTEHMGTLHSLQVLQSVFHG